MGYPQAFSQINSFKEVLNKNSLNSLDATGSRFTWDNKRRAPNHILERLDQFVANAHWLSNFPQFRSVNLDFLGSDHKLVLIDTQPSSRIIQGNHHKVFSFNHKLVIVRGLQGDLC